MLHRRPNRIDVENRCRRCHNQHHNEYMRSNPFARRKRNWKQQYGTTLEEYQQAYEYQEGLCAICRQPDSRGYLLAVDHSHGTGALRGLLCGRCNLTLGQVKDDINLLSAMIAYLECHNAK